MQVQLLILYPAQQMVRIGLGFHMLFQLKTLILVLLIKISLPWYCYLRNAMIFFYTLIPIFMKIAALFFILISLLSLSQVFSQQVESLHSIKAGIPSITYSYEHALGKQFSINMEAGANWGYYYSNNSTEIIFNPVLKIEPRLYYSVKRRFEIDRFTNNSASFFCVTTSVELGTLEKYERSNL